MPGLRSNSVALTWLLVIAATVAMVAGHVLVLRSEAGESFTLYKTWVSEFAAAAPYGWVIKLAIGFYCLALVNFFLLLIARHAHQPMAGFIHFGLLLLATAMIGGLILVIMYDIHRPSWWDSMRQRIWGPSDDKIEGTHHTTGFVMFVTGFCMTALLLAVLEWKSVNRSSMAVTAYLIVLALALLAWLVVMRSQSSFPGIPQRALLVVVTVWLLRDSARSSTPIPANHSPSPR
jgi:hypothetical protein